MFAAHIIGGNIANNEARGLTYGEIFETAQKMIEESDRICAERQARITAAAQNQTAGGAGNWFPNK